MTPSTVMKLPTVRRTIGEPSGLRNGCEVAVAVAAAWRLTSVVAAGMMDVTRAGILRIVMKIVGKGQREVLIVFAE